MKTNYKYIHFQATFTSSWHVVNTKHRDMLGSVVFYPEWKQWVFQPAGGDVVFSSDCLEDIQDFIKQLSQKPEPAHA